jgi:hypothetical protein
MKLHDWLFEVVEEICWDREYLYRSYVETFTALMRSIYEHGPHAARDAIVIPGLKSGIEVALEWRLAHQLDFRGPNTLHVSAMRRDAGAAGAAGASGAARTAVFDLSTGDEAAG